MMFLWYKVQSFFGDKEGLYFSLRKLLGFSPWHLSYYRLALMHKSLCERDKNGRFLNNERLEFLGDAIIEAVVSDLLYRKFSYAHEGFLTTTRSKLVQRSALNELSSQLGLDKMVRYSCTKESHNNSLGGNAFEALVGAIYLDQGYSRSRWFIERLIKKGYIKIEATAKKEENFKSVLLEWSQKNKMKVYFDSVAAEKQDNNKDKLFQTVVYVESREMGKGNGFSKKESQQKAASKTMDMLKRITPLRKGIFRRRLTRLVIEDMMAFLPEYEQMK